MNSNYDPDKWKYGIFYYNKEDKRVFPPKRYGIGWTVNFANPLSIFFCVAIIVVVIVFFNFLSHL